MFDPVDGTTNFAHGLPIFCSSLALEIDGEPAVAAIYDPTRRELFTAERGQGAWLNGAPLRVSSARTLIDSLLCTGFPYSVQHDADERSWVCSAKFLTRVARRAPARHRPRSISRTSRPAGSTASGSSRCSPGTSPPAR